MPRTITVRGEGRISVKPDEIELTMTGETKNADYAAAMASAEEEIGKIARAVGEAGFPRDMLKTTSLNARTDYEGVHEPDGTWRQRFAGYVVSVSLKLSFPLDMTKLAAVLASIAESGATPQLSICFTLHDPESARKALLEEACRDAREKASILADASGVKLGDLLSVSYNWSETRFQSPTMMEADNGAAVRMAKAAFGADMTPDDIALTDAAGFVWEIA